MAGEYMYGDARPVMAPAPLATAFEAGDIVGLDSNGDTVKASATTWDTNLATTQTAFALLFLGRCAQKKAAAARVFGNAGPHEAKIRVDTGGVYKYPAAAGTYKIGTLVGPAKQSGNALEDQIVDDVATEALAIGRVVAFEGVNPTYVYVELLSKQVPAARQT